jgi:hypothetical protein
LVVQELLELINRFEDVRRAVWQEVSSYFLDAFYQFVEFLLDAPLFLGSFGDLLDLLLELSHAVIEQRLKR